jgi:hypothetical protein
VTENEAFDGVVGTRYSGYSPLERQSTPRIGKIQRIAAAALLSACATFLWASPAARSTLWNVVRDGMQCSLAPFHIGVIKP